MWTTVKESKEKIKIVFSKNTVYKENNKSYVKKSFQKLSYSKLSKQNEIENLNKENNILSNNKNLCQHTIDSMKRINVNDLFKGKDISYASVLLSSKDEYNDTVSTDLVSIDSLDTKSISSDSVSSDSVSSDSVSLVDESNEVKSIRLLLLKFQNLERVLINTGNGNKDDFESIYNSIFSLTKKLKTIV